MLCQLNYQTDIFAITETHLDNTVKGDDLLITGYHTPIRKNRNRLGGGGGVALYISKKNSYWDQFQQDMQLALDANIPVNLLGDFKVNMWSDQSKTFKHMLQRLNLKVI